MNKVLIIDDDVDVQRVLTKIFELKNYKVTVKGTAQSAIEELKNYSYDVVILDIRLPDKDGIECLKEIKNIDESIPVVILTAYGNIKQTVEAMKLGAFDYLTKPVSNDELILTIERAIKEKSIQRELAYLRGKLSVSKEIIYKSDIMKNIIDEAIKIAKTDYTVLITGETGVGKEILANIIYKNSNRKDGPFIVLDCGAIPETLIESELFGYEKGAFTGADKRCIGKIELANGGTLFLDEISNLPFNLQTKFLRVLEQKKLYRIGGTDLVEVDVRLIVASNVPLEKLVEEGKFRKDLYYRLSEYKITIPPLRERKDDIIPLTEYFIKKANSELGKSIKGISDEAKKILLDYFWPGNVRELCNVIKSASFFADSIIEPKHLHRVLPLDSYRYKETNSFDNYDLNYNIEKLEKNLILNILQRTNYNKYKTAEILGISRKTLYQKLKKYNLLKEETK